MKTVLNRSEKFCVSRGEKVETSRLVKNIHWYQQKINDAIASDPVSLDDLGAEHLPNLKITAHKAVIPLRELDVTFRRAHEIAAAAKITSDTTLERVNSYTMSVLDALQRLHYPDATTLKSTADASDICDSVLNEVSILNTWVTLVEPVRMREVVSQRKEKELEFITEEQDPTYDPRDDSSDTAEEVIPGTPEVFTAPVHSIRPTKRADAVCHSVNPVICTDPSEQADAVYMSVPKKSQFAKPPLMLNGRTTAS